MLEELWAKIEQGFARYPSAKANSISLEYLNEKMHEFYNIDKDYIDFIIRYGGGIVGSVPIYGLDTPEWIGTIDGRSTAPEITQWFREKKWPGIESWLIFSIDQGGNPIGFAPDGTVWISDMMDFGQIAQIADNFQDYIEIWCLQTKETKEY